MKTDPEVSTQYLLGNVEPYRNVCDGWGIRADLLLNGDRVAKVDDAGDGTSPGIFWENNDSEANAVNMDALVRWYVLCEPSEDLPDIEEAIWFLRDLWVNTLS